VLAALLRGKMFFLLLTNSVTVQRTMTKLRNRSFAAADPRVCNSLMGAIDNYECFARLLKKQFLIEDVELSDFFSFRHHVQINVINYYYSYHSYIISFIILMQLIRMHNTEY